MLLGPTVQMRYVYPVMLALPYLLALLWKISNSVTAQVAPECIEKAQIEKT